MESSGAVEVSISLSMDCRKLGPAPVLLWVIDVREEEDGTSLEPRRGVWEAVEEVSAASRLRRVRGRLRGRSGMAVGSLDEGSTGDVVADFRFRFGVGSDSISFAFSNAFQARISSRDSGSGRAGCSRLGPPKSSSEAVSRNRLAPPCLSATCNLRSHSRNSRRWEEARVALSSSFAAPPSSSKGKSRSRLRLSHTDCHTRAQLDDDAWARFRIRCC